MHKDIYTLANLFAEKMHRILALNSRYLSMHVHTIAEFSILTKVGDIDCFSHLNYIIYHQFVVSRMCWFQQRRGKKWITSLGSSVLLALVRFCKQQRLGLIQASHNA